MALSAQKLPIAHLCAKFGPCFIINLILRVCVRYVRYVRRRQTKPVLSNLASVDRTGKFIHNKIII